MRKIAAVLVFAVVTVLTSAAHATTLVSFSLDPALIGSPMAAGEFDVHSTGLNGAVLNGQLLSLDLVYADGILARVLTATSIDMGLSLSTNTSFSCLTFPSLGCGNWPGFPTGLTGNLLTPDGSALQPPQGLGSEMGSDGSLGVGLSPGVTSPTPGGANYELSGAHLEFLLPNTGFEVTDARLRLIARPSSATVQFGTEAQLPDGDSWSLIPIASCVMLGTLFAGRFLRDRRHRTRLPEFRSSRAPAK
jgi:hypothetical protein